MRTRLWGLVAASALLTGCVQMPTSGPVVESEVSGDSDDAPGISYDPRPPQEGAPAADIVDGFLEAMQATPIGTTVARQFLSREAAETWVPDEQIITYAELGDVSAGTEVRVPLTDVNRYDERGAWERTQAGATLSLGLVEEDGEWRIDEVPDALIVPETWFGDWYERASLYYFDPSAEVLVPEPVFAPRGDQFASSLVRGLVTQPTDEEADVVRTSFPPGPTQGLSVPIVSGIARVALSGDPDTADDETADRMRAQLAWTLRQDDRINAIELSVGGEAFGVTGSPQFGLEFGSGYDPNGSDLSTEMFALDRGLVVAGSLGAFEATSGPLGQQDLGLRSISVSIDGSRVAGVAGDGTTLVSAPTEAPSGEVATLVSGAVDLAAPGWDHRGRAWVLDRGAGSARVYLVADGAAREVVVPGISGRRVTRLLVSRDGTRLVAVRRGPKVDTVLSGRIRHDTSGAVIGFTPLTPLAVPVEGDARVRDIAWRSPTAVSVLSDITTGSLVRTVSVDGAPGEITTTGTSRPRGPNRVLVSSPVDRPVSTEVYALAGRAVTSLSRPERTVPDLPAGLTSLTYVG